MMIKRITSFIIAVAICTALIPVSVLAEEVAVDPNKIKITGYLPGDSTFSVKKDLCIDTRDANITTTGVKINAGGSATFGFFMPFNYRSMTIKYTGAAGSTEIKIGENVYTITPENESGEYLLEFGKYLSIEPQHYHYIGSQTYLETEFVERRGETEIVVSSTGGITISEMLLEREITVTAPTDNNNCNVPPNITDEDEKMMSTILIDESAPIIVVNGGRRYINLDDVTEKPFYYNGRLYLPIKTLAYAMGYYHEDIPEKGYALLRGNTHEVVLMEDKCTVNSTLGEETPAPDDALIYHNGKTYAAVRYFAELNGDTVGYKDGLVVIDNKYTVEEIYNEESLLTKAMSEFEKFKEPRRTGTTYYVAQTPIASDENDGSSLAPFKTLKKAAEEAQAGDTVIIREGVYRETLAPQNSGTESMPITFRAAEGEKVVISAADKVTHFAKALELDKENVYIATLTDEFGNKWDLGDGRNQVFINGEMMTEARYPNGPSIQEEGMLSDAWPVRGDLYRPYNPKTNPQELRDELSNVVYSDTLLCQEEENYWQGGYYVGLFGHGYALSTAKIEASSFGKITLGEKTKKWWWEHDGSADPYNYGYIVGHINALDAPKEWIIKDKTLYIMFPEGVDPKTANVEVKKRQLVIDIADCSYVNIEGIETIGGGVKMNNSNMCMLNHMNMKYIGHYTHSSDQREGFIDFPKDTKDPNGAPIRGEVGVYIGGTDNIVANSVIDHSAGAGIYGVGLYTYIENNLVKDCGYMGSYTAGMYFTSRGTEPVSTPRGGHAIYNNEMYNAGRTPIVFQVSQDAGHAHGPYIPYEVAYNEVYNGMLTSVDTGLVYEYCINASHNGQFSKLHHNYVYMTYSGDFKNAYSFGIYHDGHSLGVDTYNNVVYYTGKGAGFSHNPIHESRAVDTAAYHNIWNNMYAGYVENGTLTKENFPQEKPFYAGTYDGAKNYTQNYELIKNDSYGLKHIASSAALSNGLELKDGYAVFTQNGQSITFKDVDFGEGTNTIVLGVKGDKYYSHDALEITVVDENGVTNTYTAEMQLRSPEKNFDDTLEVEIGYTKGINDVTIKMVDYRSLQIGSLAVKHNKDDETNFVYSQFVYCGDYDSVDMSGRLHEGQGDPIIKTDADGYNYANNTWGGTVFKYEDQEFKTDVNYLVLGAGSGGKYLYQEAEVYVDSLDSEPVGTVFVNNEGWENKNPLVAKLTTTISAGTHDVYLSFPSDNGGDGKSSNIFFLGFVKGAEDMEFVDTAKSFIYGGDFDTTESIDNEEFPFEQNRYVRIPDYTKYGLINTLPGTMAVYKDKYIRKSSNAVVITYNADEEFCGQSVELRIGSPDSEPIASFVTEACNGRDDFKDITFRLDETIEQGIHTFYLSFGGEDGTYKTCRISCMEFVNLD